MSKEPWNRDYRDPRKENLSDFHKYPGRPKFNEQQIPFEKWNWQEQDSEFFRQFHRMPESRDPATRRGVMWQRYHMSLNKGPKKIDLSPRVFLKTMRLEVGVLIFGIILGLSTPFIWRKHLQSKGYTPLGRQNDEVNPDPYPQVLRIDQNPLHYYAYKDKDDWNAQLEYNRQRAFAKEIEQEQKKLSE